jgi:hypothetical protein
VSPTGALFSPQLEIIGRNEPSYDAQRQVEESIYDYFAMRMEGNDLQPSADMFQKLRLAVAEAAKNNPLLAKALAASAGISENTDLISAAKAAIVVEDLDSVAYGASGEFAAAERAIMDLGNPSPEEQRRLTLADRDSIAKYRNRHANLAAQWDTRQISPRALRKELVKYYVDSGCQKLNDRFLRSEK